VIFFSSINVFEVNQSFGQSRLLMMDQKTPYALSKARGEFLFAGEMNSCTVIRPTNLFGKSQRRKHSIVGESHVIPDLLEKIEQGGDLKVLGDGTQVRNFVHVTDVCDFVVRNLLLSGQHFFNLRSEITITIGELARLLTEFAGRQVKVRFDHSYMVYELFRITDFDLSLPVEFGWKPKITKIEDGLLI